MSALTNNYWSFYKILVLKLIRSNEFYLY